ncbi:MAG: polymorphic toxin-type HINT domain-containing protein [Nocardiopsaceae bacterium]|nr:polymorphic toxin-type HINT domain-containing protein [Nocardiopsaceae bacterium]
MLRRIHDPERGASFLEYAGIILVVSAIIVTVFASGVGGIGPRVGSGIEAAFEKAFGGEGTGSTTADSAENPENSSDGDGSDGSDGSGGEASGENDDGGGGFLDGLSDIGNGAWDAVTDTFDFSGAWDSLTDNAQRLWDDPGQWLSDTADSVVQSASNAWDSLTDDPVGFVRDFLFSDQVQDKWNNGDKLDAGAQAVTENLLGLIPYFGWGKKIDRINDIANAGRNDRDNGDTDGEAQADGPPPNRGEDDSDEDDGSDRNDGITCSRPSSFVPGTPVLLADGTYVPIEDVRVGHEVLAFDPLTGEEGAREVTDLISSTGDKVLVDITVDDGRGGADTITATDEHPFWAPEIGQWVDAIDLAPGTWLRTSSGAWAQISAVDTQHVGDQRVHNLTIDDLSTYYVDAGSGTWLLVHNDNDNDPCPYSGDLKKVDKPDPHADALAERLDGESRVRFENDPTNREFDAISDDYVAQAKPSNVQVNKKFRGQAKATFEAAQATGREVYYHFEGGPPSAEVRNRLEEYSERYGVDVVIDDQPLNVE